MRAALLIEPRQPLVLADIGIDEPGPDEVRIRTVASGICHTDLSVADGLIGGPVPMLLGHEVAGVVEQIGANVSRVKVGDHVVTSPSGYCGACEDCLEGHMNRCGTPGTRRRRSMPPRLTTAGAEGKAVSAFSEIGGFASEVLVNERICVPISKEMPLDRAAIIGCAITTGFGAVTHSAGVKMGQTVVVLGCGGIGLAAINAASLAAAGRIIAIDRVPAKLELARRMGATDVIDASTTDAVEAVRQLAKEGVHHAIEAIGVKETIEQAFSMLRRGGSLTIVGIPKIGTQLSFNSFDFMSEKRVQGSLMGSNRFPVDIPRYVELYLRGQLLIDELISERIALDQVNDGLARLRSGAIPGRSVITFN